MVYLLAMAVDKPLQSVAIPVNTVALMASIPNLLIAPPPDNQPKT
jgi:hypothetical protein